MCIVQCPDINWVHIRWDECTDHICEARSPAKTIMGRSLTLCLSRNFLVTWMTCGNTRYNKKIESPAWASLYADSTHCHRTCWSLVIWFDLFTQVLDSEFWALCNKTLAQTLNKIFYSISNLHLPPVHLQMFMHECIPFLSQRMPREG